MGINTPGVAVTAFSATELLREAYSFYMLPEGSQVTGT